MRLLIKRTGALLIVFIFMAVPILAFVQRQNILDWLALRNYQPPERVASLATDASMNDLGRKLFYVHHPQVLADKAAFNTNCSGFEKTIVLGCYITGKGIYVYDVQDERLAGVHQVTSAHEMLHAAYDRLSVSERSRIDNLTNQVLASSQDERLIQTLEQYRKLDPNVINNELHSILGTEIRDLPDELEVYYNRYFNDRLKIVAYSEQYERNFTEREAKIAVFDSQLKALKLQVDTDEASLHSKLTLLEAQRSDMDAALARKDYAVYNTAVPTYNNKVKEYNNLLTKVKNQIEEYNRIVKERNAIALEEDSLIQAIDSRLQPAQ